MEMAISMRAHDTYIKPREVMRALNAARARVRLPIPLLTGSHPLADKIPTKEDCRTHAREQPESGFSLLYQRPRDAEQCG